VKPPKEDFAGRRFGKLTVMHRSIARSNRGRWHCICDCGGTIEVANHSLARGTARSCGCVSWQATHGMSGTREYQSWQDMLDRCLNPSSKGWRRYGGRGIKVQESWRRFENFFADMGPSNGLTLDRLDWDGHYEHGNCRWATYEVQSNNSGRAYVVRVGDKELTIAQFAAELGISRQAVHARIKRGALWEGDAERRSTTYLPLVKGPQITVGKT